MIKWHIQNRHFSVFDHCQREWGFAQFVLRRLGGLRILQVSGSLTFTTLLALVPLLTIVLTVMAAFPAFSDYSTRFKLMLLSNLVPEFAGRVITVYMRQFADNAERLTAVGIIMLGLTTLMLMATIERTFNTIWSVRQSRPWVQQSMIYWVVLTVGPLTLGGGILLWRWVLKVSRFERTMPVLADWVEACGSIFLTGLVLALVFRIVPNRFVPLKHAVLGGMATALLLELAKMVFGLYIENIASYKLVYGAFASVPIFLLWIYFLWMVVLIGAVFTASLSYWQGNAWQRRVEPRRRFLDAIDILLMLDHAQSQGRALSPAIMRKQVRVGYDELGVVLDKLATNGYVQKGQRDLWVLKKKLSAIPLADLFGLFIYRPDTRADDRLGQTMEQLLRPSMLVLETTSLADFAARMGRL